MRWLKKQYHRYMIRPIVTKTITRTLIGLVIVLLWDKYVNVERIGVSRLGFGLGAVGIILMAGAWFSYLHLDGLTPIDTAKKKFGVKNKKKKTKQSMGGDIADYLDEEIVPYEELDESEKAACQMAAFLISGMILVIAGIVIPLFLELTKSRAHDLLFFVNKGMIVEQRYQRKDGILWQNQKKEKQSLQEWQR